MSERTDHPPSYDDQTAAQAPARTVRRAFVGGVLGLALLIGPVALATIVLPDGGGDDSVEAAGDSETSLINARRPVSLNSEKDYMLGLQ
ncbi:MAG: hypothetical protein ACRDZS_12505, partial [Acidimicrobiales bacterium]